MTPREPAASAVGGRAPVAPETLPFVLVHGFLGGSGQWDTLIPRLAGASRVVTVDLPGFYAAADQEAPDTIEGFARHVIAKLDRQSIDRFILMGHSMGGMIVQTIARLLPERVGRLILYGTGPLGAMPDRFEPISVSLERLHKEGFDASVRRIVGVWFRDGAADPGFEPLVRIGLTSSPAAAAAALVAMSRWDGRPALPELTMPTLIVWGDEDRSYRWPQVAQLWEEIPNASLAVIPGACHAAHLEKPILFEAIVNDFLTTQEPAARSA